MSKDGIVYNGTDEVLKTLKLKTGDKLEFSVKDGQILIQPVVVVTKDQAWFWTESWQREEKIIDEQIQEGQIKSFNRIDDLIEELER